MATKTIDQLTAKANPVDADLLVIADSADNNEMKQITIGSITGDIADGIINDSSASSTTTYSSTKVDAQITAATLDASTSVKGKTKLSVAPASASNPIAVGDNDPRVPPVNTSTMTTGQVEALAGTSGTPSTSNKFVTNDDTSATSSADKVIRWDSNGNLPGTKALIDTTFPNGEAVTAGQVVFIETVTTFANATSVQNVGDVSGNTRVSFPVFGTGVAGTTFKLSLKKTVAPSVTFSFRIETDNAGSPSGTIVTNGSGTLAAASITTSFVDTTLTLDGSVTLTAGVKYHIVCFAGTYASETVNATNYFNIGYASVNTTTRPAKTWNGSAWSAVASTTFCYASSTLFNPQVLSLTDSDFSYKTDWYGITTETKAVGLFPNITIDGINANQTGLTSNTQYYLSGTPGSISSTPSSSLVGTAKGTTNILLYTKTITPIGYQRLGLFPNSSAAITGRNITTHKDGVSYDNALYISGSFGASATSRIIVYKFQDGFLYNTAVTADYSVSGAGQYVHLCVAGNYVYAFQQAASDYLKRYDVNTLANGVTMTISGTALANGTAIFSDGDSIYNIYTSGTAKKYTISGTTATSGSDTAYTSMATNICTWSDGTYVYQPGTIDVSGNCTLYRWSLAGGARTTLNSYSVTLGVSLTALGAVKQYGKNIFINVNSGVTSSIVDVIPTSSL